MMGAAILSALGLDIGPLLEELLLDIAGMLGGTTQFCKGLFQGLRTGKL